MDYSNIIQTSIVKIFSSVKLIDIMADKVYSYTFNNNNLTLSNTTSYISFADDIKKKIHPDFVNQYFNLVSIQNNHDGILSYKIKNEAEIYTDEYSVVKVLNNNGSKLILLLDIMSDFIPNVGNSDDLKDKLNLMTDNIADAILKIFNTFNNNDEPNIYTNNYIKTVLEQLVRMFPEFNKSIEKSMISEVNKSKSTLMIVDDDMMTRNLLKKAFSNDYDIIALENGKDAIDVLNENINTNENKLVKNIVGIFLDLAMPVLDGFAVLDYLKTNNIISKLPVVIISAAEDKETRQRVYSYNIADMLEKPFNLEIIKHRINNLINLYKTSDSLNELVMYKNGDVINLIKAYVDAYRYDHSDSIKNIKKYIDILGKQVINDYSKYHLDENELNKVEEASELTNIGLYAIPKKIFRENNYTKQTEYIKKHPIIGSELCKKILFFEQKDYLSEYAYNIARYHHENFDGSGYPEGLKGDDIPIYVQIASLAIDYNDLLEKGSTYQEAFKQIESYSGKKYSTNLIESFKKAKINLENINNII